MPALNLCWADLTQLDLETAIVLALVDIRRPGDKSVEHHVQPILHVYEIHASCQLKVETICTFVMMFYWTSRALWF